VFARLVAALTGLAALALFLRRQGSYSAFAPPLLAVGLLWLHIDEAPMLGVVFLSASLLLAMLAVLRWFRVTPAALRL
jgi:hypothetical protein